MKTIIIHNIDDKERIHIFANEYNEICIERERCWDEEYDAWEAIHPMTFPQDAFNKSIEKYMKLVLLF